MHSLKKKRALIIVGAGASVDYGIPVTAKFGSLIEADLQANKYCVQTGGWDAYLQIKDQLEAYYSPDTSEAHFERIYHVLHELGAMRLSKGAVPKYKPVLHPFLKKTVDLHPNALRAASQAMLAAIYKTASTRSSSPQCSIELLSRFLRSLDNCFISRIYSTNYDDFFSQAAPELFTGFTRKKENFYLFSPRDFWAGWEKPGLFHIHGSIHMGFPHNGGEEVDIGDLAWFDARDEALKYANFSGSGITRMDGTSIDRSAILTGLDKLGRIQQSPYSFYYAGLSRDVVEADLIFVLGSGLNDLHLNAWIKAVRREQTQVPLIYVSYWPNDEDFYSDVNFELKDREISIVHDLRMKLQNLSSAEYCCLEGWTIDRQTNAAVWSRGFKSFLDSPDTLAYILSEITAPR